MYSPRSPLPHRKRAFSEQFCEATDADGGILGMRAMSRNSETNLLRNNRERSFDAFSRWDNTNNLLVNVVKALTTFDEEEPEEGGIHLFSDSQIKLDEVSSVSQSATDNASVIEAPRKMRGRAASEHGWNRLVRSTRKQDAESRDWTWSGNNPQIHEFMRIRAKQKEREKNLSEMNVEAVNQNGLDAEKAGTEVNRRPSFLQRVNKLFKRRSTLPQDNNVSEMPMPEPRSMKPKSPIQYQRPSLASPLDKPSPLERRKSNFSRPQLKKQASSFSILSSVSDQDQDVLEGTTIADLIRAIEVVHMRQNGIDPRLTANRPLPGETPPPMLRKAALAFAAASHRNGRMPSQLPNPKSNVTSPTRISPLPTFDTSVQGSRRSSVTWDRLRNLRQRSITEPSKPDSPITPKDDPFASSKSNSFGQKTDPALAKNRFLQEKRGNFVRRYSAFPTSGHVNDATATRWKNLAQQMKKNVSDVDRRLSAVQVNAPHKPFGGDEYPLISQLIMNRAREELTPKAGRRFSSASSQLAQVNRSVLGTPSSIRRTSMLPISPLAGIPSVSSLATGVDQGKASGEPILMDSAEETKKTTKWRIMKRLVSKTNDKDSDSGPNS